MEPVKIRIFSMIKDETGESQTTEQRYSGTMTERSGKYYVMYHEDAQSGLEGTKTTVKWDQNRVIIMRNGAVDHRQEFAKGYRDKSIYRRPYLEIPRLTHTLYLYNYCRKIKWHLELEYTLYHGEAPYGEMKLLIEIEEV